jgi:flagellar biosynthesis protein
VQTKRPDKAIALQYSEQEELPQVTAVGSNRMAEHIIALAEEHGIPVRQDETLVQMLNGVGIGQAIPAESFALVADILSFLYHVDQSSQLLQQHC